MRQFLAKILGLPTPVDLGMSSSNALGSRHFTPFQEGPTWEDYEELIRTRYPVKYFIAYVVGGRISYQWYALRMRYWAFTSRFIHREHLIDIRGVDPLVPVYNYGPNTPRYELWIVGWRCLRRYVEEEQYGEISEEIQDLYNYWMIERVEIDKESSRVFEAYCNSKKLEDQEAYEKAREVWLDYEREVETKDADMFNRLVKALLSNS